LISVSVKSDAHQPSVGTPSNVFVATRFANSGWSATFVESRSLVSVVPMKGSWRAISTPSLVATRSGST
jgi:hypothetical protein